MCNSCQSFKIHWPLFVNYSHIFLCFCHYTMVFVLSVLNIIHVLDFGICLIPNIYIILYNPTYCITLDIFYILLIVTVDLWNVNKISISYIQIADSLVIYFNIHLQHLAIWFFYMLFNLLAPELFFFYFSTFCI